MALDVLPSVTRRTFSSLCISEQHQVTPARLGYRRSIAERDRIIQCSGTHMSTPLPTSHRRGRRGRGSPACNRRVCRIRGEMRNLQIYSLRNLFHSMRLRSIMASGTPTRPIRAGVNRVRGHSRPVSPNPISVPSNAGGREFGRGSISWSKTTAVAPAGAEDEAGCGRALRCSHRRRSPFRELRSREPHLTW